MPEGVEVRSILLHTLPTEATGFWFSPEKLKLKTEDHVIIQVWKIILKKIIFEKKT